MKNGGIFSFKEAALPQIENTNKTARLYRRIAKWPKSETGDVVIGRNDFVEERSKYIGLKCIDIVGDYLVDNQLDNHGPQEGNRGITLAINTKWETPNIS